MPMISLAYVSVSALTPADADHEVARIVAIARDFNPIADITGALIFSGEYFAQILEGDEIAVEALLQSIRRDVRHRDLIVFDRSPIRARRFRGWSMAYAGPQVFASDFVAALLEAPIGPERDAAARTLIDVMAEFVRG